jgi:hypothetical protein
VVDKFLPLKERFIRERERRGLISGGGGGLIESSMKVY